SNGLEAIQAIEGSKPDVIFLDIQMPGLNGFEVLDALSMERLPLVVFVTAFNEHAIKAFEVNALDYLLKPFEQQRQQRCLARVRQQRRSDDAGLNRLL